jgi:hypothetical protein
VPGANTEETDLRTLLRLSPFRASIGNSSSGAKR